MDEQLTCTAPIGYTFFRHPEFNLLTGVAACVS